MAKKEKPEKNLQKKGSKKTILVIVVCLFLVISIAFSFYMLLKSGKLSADDGEKYNPVFLPGDIKIVCDIEAGPGTAPADEDREAETVPETEASQAKSEIQEGTEDTPAKPTDWSEDPAARYEIMVDSARQLSETEKESFGLSKETGRLASLQLDIRLLDTSYDWSFYNRRIQDSKGNWLDEIKGITNQELLDSGQQDKQTLIFRLPAADAKAQSDESVTLYIYTTSWNTKEKADGQCEITVAPPPAPGSEPVIYNADTEFGRWTGNIYSSSVLNMSITLPENWRLQPETLQETTDTKSIEGSAVRSDNQAAFQLSVNKSVGQVSENDRINAFKNLLGKAVGHYTISEPFSCTIAGRDYLGLTYTYADVSHQIYFYKDGSDIIEVALRFPFMEESGFEEFLAGLKPLS